MYAAGVTAVTFVSDYLLVLVTKPPTSKQKHLKGLLVSTLSSGGPVMATKVTLNCSYSSLPVPLETF